MSAGLAMFLDELRPLVSDAQFTWGERRVAGIVAACTLGGFGLASWVAGRLLRASSELIELLIDGADAAWRTADLIELQLIPTLGRIAGALERTANQPAGPAPAGVAAIRRAIALGRWDDAEGSLRELAEQIPGNPILAALASDVRQAREGAVAALWGELEQARAAQDVERVLELRDALTLHLRGRALHDLDREQLRWVLKTIPALGRAGMAGPKMADLAARAVESFGEGPASAPLFALMEQLRRASGLCPRCGRPYKGSADTCLSCQSERGTDVSPDARTSSTPTSRKRQ